MLTKMVYFHYIGKRNILKFGIVKRWSNSFNSFDFSFSGWFSSILPSLNYSPRMVWKESRETK